MGNFEKLSVLVIVVIIVMILVVALYTWTEDPNAGAAPTTIEKNDLAAPPAPNGKGGSRVELPEQPKAPLANPSGAPAKSPGRSILDEILTRPTQRPAGTQDPLVVSPNPDPAVDPAVDPASVKPVEPRYYTVRASDTFAKIAKQEYPGIGQRAIDELIRANSTVDPTRMRVGTKLVLPELAAATPGTGSPAVPGTAVVRPPAPAELRPGTVYVVRKGDTLPGISKRAYRDAGRWQDIWIENFSAIDDPDHLQSGTRLKLPK